MANTASAVREKLKQVSLIYTEFACPNLHTYAGVRNTRAIQTKCMRTLQSVPSITWPYLY